MSNMKKWIPGYSLVQDIRQNKISYIMMLPFLVLFTFFIILPVGTAIFYSLTYYNIVEPPTFIGLQNFRHLFLDDEVFLIAVQNTLFFALITGPISYVMSFMFAWLVNELPSKVRAVATLLFFAPSLVGTAVTFIWGYVFGGDSYSVINGFLLRIGAIQEPILFLADPRLTMYSIIVAQLWMALGTGFLVFIAGLQGVDRTMYEAGAVDGIRNRFQELWYITLPSMKSQLLFSAVLQVSASFAAGSISRDLIGFPSPLYSTHTVILHMEDYGRMRFEMGYASAITVVLFLFTLGVNHVVRKSLGEKKKDEREDE